MKTYKQFVTELSRETLKSYRRKNASEYVVQKYRNPDGTLNRKGWNRVQGLNRSADRYEDERYRIKVPLKGKDVAPGAYTYAKPKYHAESVLLEHPLDGHIESLKRMRDYTFIHLKHLTNKMNELKSRVGTAKDKSAKIQANRKIPKK